MIDSNYLGQWVTKNTTQDENIVTIHIEQVDMIQGIAYYGAKNVSKGITTYSKSIRIHDLEYNYVRPDDVSVDSVFTRNRFSDNPEYVENINDIKDKLYTNNAEQVYTNKKEHNKLIVETKNDINYIQDEELIAVKNIISILNKQKEESNIILNIPINININKLLQSSNILCIDKSKIYSELAIYIINNIINKEYIEEQLLQNNI